MTGDASTSVDTVVQDLLARAQSEPGLAERLLADPAGLLAEATGHAVTPGVLIKTTRDADGAFTFSASQDPEFRGELEEQALEAIVGGGGPKPFVSAFHLLVACK